MGQNPPAPTGKKILLVEKNDINNKVMGRVLDWGGYQFTVATNPLDGLAAAQRQRPDLIIMGTRFIPDDTTDELWNSDGLCLLQKFHSLEAFKDIPIIIASADCLLGDAERIMAAGAAANLVLPIRPHEVLDTVHEVFARHQPGPNDGIARPEALPKCPADPPSVELETLRELTDWNIGDLRELLELYFDRTARQFTQMASAIHSDDAATLRRLARSCAGASATLGLKRLVPQLRELERLSAIETLTGADQTLNAAKIELSRIRGILQMLPELATVSSLWDQSPES